MITLPADLVPGLEVETRKVVSLRPSRLLLAGPVAVGLVGTLITALVSGAADPKGTPATGAATIGLYLGILAVLVAVTVLGVGATAGEYKRGSLALSLLFAPDRDRFLTAKYLTLGLMALFVALLTEIASTGVLLLGARGKFEFGAQFLQVVGAGLLAAVCWVIIGAGTGLLLRNVSTALIVLLGWAFVFEPLVWAVAGGVGLGGLCTLLPVSGTLAGVMAGSFPDSTLFAPAPAALLVLVFWATVAGAAGWWDLRRRDL